MRNALAFIIVALVAFTEKENPSMDFVRTPKLRERYRRGLSRKIDVKEGVTSHDSKRDSKLYVNLVEKLL